MQIKKSERSKRGIVASRENHHFPNKAQNTRITHSFLTESLLSATKTIISSSTCHCAIANIYFMISFRSYQKFGANCSCSGWSEPLLFTNAGLDSTSKYFKKIALPAPEHKSVKSNYKIQSNFNGLNTFGTMKISSNQWGLMIEPGQEV